MTLPEHDAAVSVAEIIGQFLDPHWLTTDCLTHIGTKVVANRSALRQVFADLDANPARIPARDEVLRQQPRHGLTDIEALEEELHELEREIQKKARMLADARVGHVDRFDPDDRGGDEDDARVSAERAADRAVDAAPGIAS